MTRFYNFFLLLVSSLFIFSCKDEQPPAAELVVPFEYIYPIDLQKIETFLKTHSYTQDANFNVSFTALTMVNDPSSIWGSNPSIPKTSLLNKMVSNNGVNYKVYYISLREGVKDRPTSVDDVVVDYKGQLLDLNQTLFDQNTAYSENLSKLIRGWQEMFPLFKSGTSTPNADGTLTENDDFGAAIFFIPSGLAYYNKSVSVIPAYSPLVFSIKLKIVRYVDNESDDVKTVFEDLNNDGNPFNDDSDGDGVANFADIDDDADYVPTKTEVQRPARNLVTGDILKDASGAVIYAGFYPYSGATLDDPVTTTIDERQGIPRKFTGPLRDVTQPESATNRRRPLQADYTDANRLRRHMDSSCKFPYE